MFEDIHVRELWVTLLLIPVFVIISLYFFACDTSSHQVCVVLYATAAATAALRWSCSLSLTGTLALSLSSARFLVLGSLAVRHDTTVYFTHARTRVSAGLVCTASHRTGLDWTAPQDHFARLAALLLV